jgi:hypothetical protein
MKLWSCCLVGLIAVVATGKAAHAGSLDVSVGYADNLRPSPFFPTPWIGGANVQYFLGGGPSFDAGAFRLDNNSAVPVTILPGVFVDNFAQATPFSLPIWDPMIGGGLTLLPGKTAIFTQTGSYNFDTSDTSDGFTPGSPAPNKPHVHIPVFDGTSTINLDLTDSGQVLNTGGFDLAIFPAVSPTGDGNEALNWRPIGTTGITDPSGAGCECPEPGSLALLMTGGLPLFGFLRRRKVA